MKYCRKDEFEKIVRARGEKTGVLKGSSCTTQATNVLAMYDTAVSHTVPTTIVLEYRSSGLHPAFVDWSPTTRADPDRRDQDLWIQNKHRLKL